MLAQPKLEAAKSVPIWNASSCELGKNVVFCVIFCSVLDVSNLYARAGFSTGDIAKRWQDARLCPTLANYLIFI
jgi:hypothetical protein